jgi:hypothetical protein
MHGDTPKSADLHCYECLGVAQLVDKRNPIGVCQAVSFCHAEQPVAAKSVN